MKFRLASGYGVDKRFWLGSAESVSHQERAVRLPIERDVAGSMAGRMNPFPGGQPGNAAIGRQRFEVGADVYRGGGDREAQGCVISPPPTEVSGGG